LGGGFGGKEDQASAWAAMVALAAFVLKKPVKLAMHRMDDMRMTGKRHPYSSDFKIGLDKDLKIVAYEATFHQNAGASADLSPAVLERTLFHATNSYAVPNVQVTSYCCRTNLPPNTAFRGFGGPQGMFVIESAIAHAANKLGVSAREIQRRNLMVEGSEFSYGQIADHVTRRSLLGVDRSEVRPRQTAGGCRCLQRESETHVKGMAIMPICFGISFTNTPMNHARALVHVYQDGSVGVSTGGVEMGQGPQHQDGAGRCGRLLDRSFKGEAGEHQHHARCEHQPQRGQRHCGSQRQGAGDRLQRDPRAHQGESITDPQEQAGSDHHRKRSACSTTAKTTDLDWKKLIHQCHWDRVNLSESGHYATPNIHYDKTKEKGHPFAYHVYGTAAVMVTVDRLRGTYVVDAVKLVHDFGKRMNDAVDIGQIEGGLVQGLGWMTMEEIVYNDKGKLLSNALSTYKVPDIHSVPKEITIEALPTDGHPLAIRRSKAVGEPPLMYGIGVYFAIQNAIKAFRPDARMVFDAPYTPEKVLMSLYR
jgi:xanthine dehydrogenase large subunit